MHMLYNLINPNVSISQGSYFIMIQVVRLQACHLVFSLSHRKREGGEGGEGGLMDLTLLQDILIIMQTQHENHLAKGVKLSANH